MDAPEWGHLVRRRGDETITKRGQLVDSVQSLVAGI